jgi:hypothetical protein
MVLAAEQGKRPAVDRSSACQKAKGSMLKKLFSAALVYAIAATVIALLGARLR